jgi:hypothetical protein
VTAAEATAPARDESATPVAPQERVILDSRWSLLLPGILDSISFALFYVSFPALTHLISSMWYRLSADE